MMYLNESLSKYLDDLAAKTPAPGGGSAAALVAAAGAALMSMVCNFTLGKEKYKHAESDIKKILEKSEQLRNRCQQLVDLDVEAFKSKDLDKSLAVPLEVCRLSFEAGELCPELAKKGNANLITDVSCAIYCLFAAFCSARVNVEINLKNLLETKIKENIISELEKYESALKKIRDEVEKYVRKIIRG